MNLNYVFSLTCARSLLSFIFAQWTDWHELYTSCMVINYLYCFSYIILQLENVASDDNFIRKIAFFSSFTFESLTAILTKIKLVVV